jgi:hypothetical protein
MYIVYIDVHKKVTYRYTNNQSPFFKIIENCGLIQIFHFQVYYISFYCTYCIKSLTEMLVLSKIQLTFLLHPELASKLAWISSKLYL